MVALRKPKPFTVDELEAQLGTLRGDVDKTSTSLEALKGRRRELLLSADDAQVVAHDDAVKAAERQIERLKARADALTEVLDERRIEEAEAAKAAERADAEATVARARQALAGYEAHAKAMVEIIRAVAESDAAVEQFQRAHPDDEPIAGAEQMRARPAEPEKVLKRDVIGVWVYADTRAVVPDHLLESLRASGRTGMVDVVSHSGTRPVPVISVDYERVTVLPAVAANRADKLASAIKLPSFMGGDHPDLWEPVSSPYASAVLTQIERRAAARAAREPQTLLRPLQEGQR